MFRRMFATLALALAAATPVVAADKVIAVSKVFPFLETYLKLPAADRSHFTLAYYFHVGSQPLTAPVWLVEGPRRIPAPLDAAGRVERLPTLAQLAEDQLDIGVDAATKLGVTMIITPLAPPSADMDAVELAAAIAQAAAAERKIGGIAALAMPKLKSIRFVGAPSAEAEFTDSHRAQLPLVKGVPSYNPGDMPNVRRIHLPRIPDKLDIG